MLHIPQRIRELETFGVGKFSPDEIADKAALVRQLMQARPVSPVPRISIVVPAHREEKYILATLRSLAEQTFTDCEFIIVSNGEPAGNLTQTIARACGFLVLHDPIRGIARARQTGLEAARGEIVVSTDGDTLHETHWLAGILHVFADPRVRCGAGPIRSLSPRFAVQAVQAYMAWTMFAKNALSPRLVTGVPEANSFYYRADALAAGGYDPEVHVGEGHMLFRRFHRPGAPLLFRGADLTAYVSGRRLEIQGPLRWAWLGIRNTTMQIFGSKGVPYEKYPGDVR